MDERGQPGREVPGEKQGTGSGKKGVAHDGCLLAPPGKAFRMQAVLLDKHVAVTRGSGPGRQRGIETGWHGDLGQSAA